MSKNSIVKAIKENREYIPVWGTAVIEVVSAQRSIARHAKQILIDNRKMYLPALR
jgi:hypothetical protein